MTDIQLAERGCACCIWAPEDRAIIRFCAEHHRYYVGDKELASVSSVLRVMPQKACNECKWPFYSEHGVNCSVKGKIEHARERGVRVDRYVAEYLRTGEAIRISPGSEWQEVADLVKKVVPWLDKGLQYEPQRIVHDDEIAGTCDLIGSGPDSGRVLADLKATYDAGGLDHRCQLGAYAELCQASQGWTPDVVGIVHVTERYSKPRWIPFDVGECIQQWQTVKAFWKLTKNGNGK